MEENFCIVSGVLDRLTQYIAGEMEYQPQTGSRARDRKYADYFHDWCGLIVSAGTVIDDHRHVVTIQIVNVARLSHHSR